MPRSQMHGSVLKLLGSRSFDIVAKYQTHRLKIPSFDNMNQASREILLVLIRKVHISITRVASEPFDLSSKSQLHVRDCNCRVCYEIMIFNLTPTQTIRNRNVATSDNSPLFASVQYTGQESFCHHSYSRKTEALFSAVNTIVDIVTLTIRLRKPKMMIKLTIGIVGSEEEIRISVHVSVPGG
jgi:hypothetical protein